VQLTANSAAGTAATRTAAKRTTNAGFMTLPLFGVRAADSYGEYC
jgi:hypothetical protein